MENVDRINSDCVSATASDLKAKVNQQASLAPLKIAQP